MLTSPISITIGGTAHSLSRINNDNFTAVYLKKAVGLELLLTIRHAYEGKPGKGQMERHNIDLKQTTWDVDGNPVINQSYHVVRCPRGVDPLTVVDIEKGLNSFSTTNIAAIVGWES